MKTLPAFSKLSQVLHRRSINVLGVIEDRMSLIMLGWLCVVALASVVRIVISPAAHVAMSGAMILPYLLLIGGPIVSLALALRWFADAEGMAQPRVRLARYGQWQEVSAAKAGRHPLYGTSGIMVSLLVGMLMNVPFRAAEYLLTMPALAGNAPQWLAVLHFWMTFDAVLMSSLYMVCFAAALRRAPFFPRLLLLVWLLDIAMQLVIAQGAVAADLPGSVAAPLHQLLEKNITKVLISVGLWLPYLLLSTRVNVTYRHRVPA